MALLVAGLDGDFNLRRLERYLAVAWSSGVMPIVTLSALTGDHVGDLEPFLVPGTTAAILGSSGVGSRRWSTRCFGEARQATASVREDDSRGRHTTTHRELFELPGGALLVDTPGIRSLEVAGADLGVDTAFDDIADLAAACRFSDCGHGSEPGCAIRRALDDGSLDPARLASYRKLDRELQHAERKGDPRAQAEERRRWKIIHKAVGRQMNDKYGNDR